ncbi:MAG: sodium:calcium antiporter [Phycisphaeraceae bacterium]
MLAILPDGWFAGQHTAALVVLALICLAVVIKGADGLVEAAAGIAYRAGLPKVIVGATIVSLGTTSPEAAVSVLAAWGGNAGLALGNGVGSIIADTGLIFGVGCLIAALPADRFVLNRQGWVQLGSAVLLAVIAYSAWAWQGEAAQLERWVGVLMVTLLVAYLAISVRWSKQHPYGEPGMPIDTDPVADEVATVPPEQEVTTGRSLPVLLMLGGIGLAMVILGGDALVSSVSVITIRRGVPEVVVASTLVAMGTSLPELMVAITSIRKGHPELLVGNVIGADVLNVLFVIGASALAKPLPLIETQIETPAPAIFLWLHLPTMLAVLVLMRLFIFQAVRKGSFSRWMGAPLVAMYVAFIALQYYFSLPRGG